MGRNDAQARGWGTGWPSCHPEQMVWLKRGDGFNQPLRHEIVPLVAWLMSETEKRGYDIRPDWSWGYNCRAIRGTNVPSNHSWGLALDINAPTNPMIQGSLRSDMPEWMPGLWISHGFFWGGNYGPSHWDGHKWVGTGANRYDGMHYEFVLTPADAARITASLKPGGTAPLHLTRTLKVGVHGDDVRSLQNFLLVMSVRHKDASVSPGAPDGVFGPKTNTAVLNFKAEVDALDVMAGKPLLFAKPLNGEVGPITYGAIQYFAAN